MAAPKSEFDAYSQNYQKLVNQSVGFPGLTVDFFTQGKANFFNKRLGNTKGLKILDIGCGIGQIHPLIQNFERSITGVDVSEESLKVAQAQNPDNTYLPYDGRKLPFKDNSFDVALTICVMHHVPLQQWQNFACEMTRVVKPGGWIFIFEHNPYNPLTRLAVNRCPFDKDAVLLTAKKTERLLSSTGTELKFQSDYIFFTPFKHPWFQKIDSFLRKLPLGGQYCTYGQKKVF